MNKLRFFYALFLVVFITACGGSTSSNQAAESSEPAESAVEPTAVASEPTAESPSSTDISDMPALVGLWDVSLAGEHGYMVFAGDGTYFFSLNQETIVDDPLVTGEYWLEDGQLHLHDLENAGHWTECAEEGVYDMTFAEDGTLTFVTVEDNCNEGGFTRNYVMKNTIWTYLGERPNDKS
jgi:hypothetical protein